jgi:NTE family protein
MPGIFPPVSRDGRMFYDGGLGDNVPMRDAIAMGARSLVVLDTTSPSADLDPPSRLVDLFSYVTEVYARQQVVRDLHELTHIPILYPPSPASGTMSPLDLDHTEDLMAASYRDTVEYLTLKMAAT